MLDNPTFYPTTAALTAKMVAKIKGIPKKVLDPHGGKGDLIEGVKSSGKYDSWNPADISTIEIDGNLQALLRGKGIKVLDSDFLAFSGPDQFDLIIANPPFAGGDKHLLKAIDIMYRGQIIFLLNAETIRNPYTNTRKLLAQKLKELGANIEFIQGAFSEAERKTDVEIALIDIHIDRKVEDDLFADCDDHAARAHQTVQEHHEISTGKTIPELVAEYNQIVQVGMDTIVAYYRNYNRVGKYLGLNSEAKGNKHTPRSAADLTEKMQYALNNMLRNVRADFWRQTLNMEAVRSRMTSEKQREFESALDQRCHMDFTESNIRQFILNIIGGYEATLTEAVMTLFDKFTIDHSYQGDVHEKNIHYFNGWKTNKAFKVGKKVIIPGGNWDNSFFDDLFNSWKVSHDTIGILEDIDKVMNFFDGKSSYVSIRQALEEEFRNHPRASRQSGIESTYFTITCHKKGTIHLTFRDMDILRRFNVTACRGKGWLPQDYGEKGFALMTHEEQSVVESFEGKASYGKNLNQPLFRASSFLQLEAA